MTKTVIALLRGINVGGRNKLPMRELVLLLEKLGLTGIKTYIQSGNVLFETDRPDWATVGDEIKAAIEQAHAFSPRILILSLDDLKTAVAQNPYPEATAEPKSLHFYFLNARPPNPDWARLETLKMGREQFELIDTVFYLHAPDGIGRSKLAAKVEKALGVAATARNWRTVSKLLEMATAAAS